MLWCDLKEELATDSSEDLSLIYLLYVLLAIGSYVVPSNHVICNCKIPFLLCLTMESCRDICV